MARDYETYKQEVSDDVEEILRVAGCQPIIFIGSGFSQRYANAPTWDGLLEKLASLCPLIPRNYGYYKQTYSDPTKIGSIFADFYRDWAWGEGASTFPSDLLQATSPGNAFIKFQASRILHDLGAVGNSYGSTELDEEIKALKRMNPHAIVTTNYDELLEEIFPEYSRIIGQQILRQPYLSVGEIFKIHGCVSDPLSMVLTEEDYTEFESDKKYLSAKLLTYFAEHPLLFVGYSATDPNIKSVLYDVDRMVRANFQLIPNIYILEYDPSIDKNTFPAFDRVLSVAPDREIRIKSIKASNFQWVYECFSNGGVLEKVNMKLLRALMARTVDLVRKDVPTKRVEIDFQMLDRKLSEGGSIATLLGVASVDHAAKVNLTFPLTPTDVAKELGFSSPYYVNKLINEITASTGIDIKSFDNSYHIKMMAGKKTPMHKYSYALLDLLKNVRDGNCIELPEEFYLQ